MKARRFRPRRYQLRKAAVRAVQEGHPWIFRGALSSAAEVLDDGQWLELFDGQNQVVGYGVYQAQGGIAIRVLARKPPGLDHFERCLRRAIRKRAGLEAETNAYRVVHGETDHLAGVVLDRYADTLVLQSYSAGVDSLGRYLAGRAADYLQLSRVILKPPNRRLGAERSSRFLRGSGPGLVRFHEGPLELAADLLEGQKSGTFLDLRGLRRYLREQSLEGRRVLNLFAYTGTAGLAACAAGAAEVVNLDADQSALDFGATHHQAPAQRWVAADIFEWVARSEPDETFDLIVVDPPSVASTTDQVPRALGIYRRLYRKLLPRLRPGGRIVACCCTSRIPPGRFERTVGEGLIGLKLRQRLPMEVDHRPGFPEANYLKVTVWS